MPSSDTEEQFAEVYELQVNGQAQSDHRQKRKARLRFARRGALATACLLIGVCVFSVLDPAAMRTASSYFSSTQIDLSGVIYPNDASGAPPPPPSDFISHEEETPVEHRDFKNIEEIHAAYGVTVYEPTQMIGSMKPVNVEAIVSDGWLTMLGYKYGADENFIVYIIITPSGDTPDLNFPEDTFLHTAPAGEFNVHKAVSSGWFATAYTGESIVSIHGKMEKDDFLSMLDTLRIVN
jgi:hypothetical protein